MTNRIGAFEAKTKFSEILRRVDEGERFTVTVRGRVVAEIAPPSSVRNPIPQAVMERLRHPVVSGITADEIRAALEAGRR